MGRNGKKEDQRKIVMKGIKESVAKGQKTEWKNSRGNRFIKARIKIEKWVKEKMEMKLWRK